MIGMFLSSVLQSLLNCLCPSYIRDVLCIAFVILIKGRKRL